VWGPKPASQSVAIMATVLDHDDPTTTYPPQTIEAAMQRMCPRVLGVDQRAITRTTFDAKGSATRSTTWQVPGVPTSPADAASARPDANPPPGGLVADQRTK
jgi:hypothetical protein